MNAARESFQMVTLDFKLFVIGEFYEIVVTVLGEMT